MSTATPALVQVPTLEEEGVARSRRGSLVGLPHRKGHPTTNRLTRHRAHSVSRISTDEFMRFDHD